MWGGEFGRAPTSEGAKGRDHDHYGYTIWMAGGGVKSGFSYGATDEFGLTAVHNRMHVHDLHATILHYENGLTPNDKASKNILLRRAYLTLIGIPPTPNELQNFLNRLIETLLPGARTLFISSS